MGRNRTEGLDGVPALLEVERRFPLLAAHASDLTYRYRLRPERGFEHIGASVTRITGHTPAEHYADPGLFASLVHPHDLALFETMLRTPGALEEPIRLRLIHRDGHVVWTEHFLAHVFDATSDAVAVEGLARDVTERVVAEDELWRTVEALRRSEEDRRRLLSMLMEAEQRERRRLASDLHDDTIQVLAASTMRAEALRRHMGTAEGRQEARLLEEMLRGTVQRLRSLIFELRPPGLDGDGLAASLRLYLRKLTEDCGVVADLADDVVEEPSAEVRSTLYRIAQEALTNVRKHARARRVHVTLSQRDGGYGLRVEDDGVGLGRHVGAAVPGHIGFPAMRERAELVGGWCTIHGAPGAGTTVEAWVPSEPQ
jgi:PAS domain S-box-containing protein